jgi:hypothetical protein
MEIRCNNLNLPETKNLAPELHGPPEVKTWTHKDIKIAGYNVYGPPEVKTWTHKDIKIAGYNVYGPPRPPKGGLCFPPLRSLCSIPEIKSCQTLHVNADSAKSVSCTNGPLEQITSPITNFNPPLGGQGGRNTMQQFIKLGQGGRNTMQQFIKLGQGGRRFGYAQRPEVECCHQPQAVSRQPAASRFINSKIIHPKSEI